MLLRTHTAMDAYIITLFIMGVAALGMAWLPRLLKETFISYPMVYLLLGVGLYALPFELPLPRLREESILRVTELSVIITLMGTGLKIDRRFGFRRWQLPLRLVVITMPLCVAAVAMWAGWGLGWPVASAVLLAAVLAPTDPVLADDVQVGPPQEGEEDEVRFTLTAEAGLNDGTAFPFTWLAIGLTAVSAASMADTPWLTWVGRDLLMRLAIGTAVGVAAGRILAWAVFRPAGQTYKPSTKDSLVAISTTLGVYGLTELLHGYGFVAVFLTGLVFGRYERKNEYHKQLHTFTEQIERLFTVFILVILGGSIARGVLSSLTWPMVGLAVGFLLVVRPLTGWLALVGSRLSGREKFVISFFGIRGVGSFFYLAFALQKESFAEGESLWALVALIVAISVVMHGLLATPVMRSLETRGGTPEAPGSKQPAGSAGPGHHEGQRPQVRT